MDSNTAIFDTALAIIMLFVGAILSPRILAIFDRYWGRFSIASRKRTAKTIQQEYSRVENFHKDLQMFYLFAVRRFAKALGLILVEIFGIAVLISVNSDSANHSSYTPLFIMAVLLLNGYIGSNTLSDIGQTADRLIQFDSYAEKTCNKLAALSFLTAEDELFISKVYEAISQERKNQMAKLAQEKQNK